MTSTNGDIPTEPAAPAAQVAAAQRFAEALVIGFEVCEQGGMPLLQVALIEAALLQFDGLTVDLDSLAVIGKMLHELRRNRHKD